MTASTPRAPKSSGARAVLVDVVSVALATVAAALTAVTLDPDWTLASLLAFALAALGSSRSAWLVAVLGVAGVGWGTAFARVIVHTTTWPAPVTLDWARSLLTLVLGGFVAVIAHRQINQSQREIDQAIAFAEDATVHDPLTGLANRKGLDMLGAQILETARRRGDAVYCMFLDVDGLAKVNAELGHARGDEVLLTVSEALTRSTRATDAVARWAEDEFVVVGPGTGLAPLEMERRVRARCLESSPVPRTAWAARISAGGAVLEPWDDGDVNSLLRQADREMHLRRALRREAAAPQYHPARIEHSANPPDLRRPAS